MQSTSIDNDAIKKWLLFIDCCHLISWSPLLWTFSWSVSTPAVNYLVVNIIVYRCYITRYQSARRTASRQRSYHTYYGCGWWGRRRCSRYSYNQYWTLYKLYFIRTHYYEEYYNYYITISYAQSICCTGTHTGVYPYCTRKAITIISMECLMLYYL